jgi:phosphatidylcholine synthase
VLIEKPADASSPGGRLLAWGVHLVTAAGAALALLALDAVFRRDYREALLWLLASLALDGIDGTLARLAKVKERLPRVDGEALDLVIDYLTYVVVPALIIWRIGVLPDALALPLTAMVMMSSLYVFARRDMKTEDGYFRGFPALWNIVALYFVIVPLTPTAATAIVTVLILLTFAPVHVPHPFRVRDHGAWLPALAILWAAATAALLLPGLGESATQLLIAASLGSAAIIVGMGLLRSLRGPRP